MVPGRIPILAERMVIPHVERAKSPTNVLNDVSNEGALNSSFGDGKKLLDRSESSRLSLDCCNETIGVIRDVVSSNSSSDVAVVVVDVDDDDDDVVGVMVPRLEDVGA